MQPDLLEHLSPFWQGVISLGVAIGTIGGALYVYLRKAPRPPPGEPAGLHVLAGGFADRQAIAALERLSSAVERLADVNEATAEAAAERLRDARHEAELAELRRQIHDLQEGRR